MERNALRGGDKKAKAEFVSFFQIPTGITRVVISEARSFLDVLQEILKKIRDLVAEEKKDVRFGVWNANEVSKK